jgi:predicted acetyltransferase
MGMAEYGLRTAGDDDFPALYRILSLAFNDDPDEAVQASDRLVYEPERTLLAVAGEAIVGVAAAYTRDLTIPGGQVPAAHVTMVGVDPPHRRRGVLTRMMREQLTDVRARGEALAVLWASEGRIYQRYGYGLAARRLSFEIEREAQLRDVPPPGGLRGAVPADVSAELHKVYEQVSLDRTGWSSRNSNWWDYVLADVPKQRYNATSLRAVLHEGADGVDGYALWRVRNEWSPNGPKGVVLVRELVAANPEAYRSLWHYVLNVDLTRETWLHFGAVDEPLQYLVNEPRRLAGRIGDALWLRLADVPAALAARRYAAPVDVVIEVEDHLVPENAGAWHLVGDQAGATCRPAPRPAELRCDVGVLGAVYLGDATLAGLAAGGRVEELVPGTLGAASTAFGWYRTPSATEVF